MSEQELSTLPDPNIPDADLRRVLRRMEEDLQSLRMHIEKRGTANPEGTNASGLTKGGSATDSNR